MSKVQFTRVLLATAALMLALGMFAGLCSCGKKTEGEPYGTSEAEAELQVIADDTLRPQVNDTGGATFAQFGAATAEEFANITFSAPVFCSADGNADQVKAALSANPDADMVFARGSVVDELEAEGLLVGNDTALNIAEIPILDQVYLVAARAAGSTADLPPSRLVGGADDATSNEWRLAYLPDWNGVIAVGPEATCAGQAFNQALATVGLYTDESGKGGQYASSIAGKVKVCDSTAAALDAMKAGNADLAFVYSFDLPKDDASMESFYEVPLQLYAFRPNYKGAVLPTSQHQDAARWYLSNLYQQI